MNTKWYLCTLLILFIFLCTIQENKPVPNQEIVLEFTNSEINDLEKQNTIIELKNRLRSAGALNIQVQKSKKGNLKIAYYSTEHVSNIKDALSIQGDVSKTISKFPLEENNYPSEKTAKFNIDVYEIDTTTYATNFDGNSILEIKYNSDSSTTTQSYGSSSKLTGLRSGETHKLNSKFCNPNRIVKNSTSHNIPEVRAGPHPYFS